VLPSDAGYQCFPDDPGKVRKPDASFIQAARLAVEDEPEGWARIAPDLAVEVVSPNDLFEAVAIKVREYLSDDLFAPPLGWHFLSPNCLAALHDLNSIPSGYFYLPTHRYFLNDLWLLTLYTPA
jgi:hypothetical protein